ncbi:MAG: DNA alkylation repair protein [Candidatus Thorarchaeota archaeon]
MSRTDSIVRSIHSHLQAMSNPVRKEKIAKYMKTSSLRFIGVELPTIHQIVRDHIKPLKTEELSKLMTGLWSVKTFEFRIAAIDVMKVYARKGPVSSTLEIADRWIDDLDTWGLADPLCQPCLGILLLRDPSVETSFKRWKTSINFWRRRCSVLPYLYLCLKANYRPDFGPRIIRAVEPHISDSEFFVGKAAGWVLRELSKRDPELVRSFIESNTDKMTRLVRREGSLKLGHVR